ncbi:DUF6602 domain-containing protein [Dyadobacter sp. CY323]|uniref:DUF6602 domain-containing protein n=1 Tax=Dyadobacter sp. CY323 TaxID=2907302 RepID=UPI001F3FD06E|nr:DUF6602 domain-containing protein [Dyadobacter sp. CY323]MCE6989019.1 hypothetical protein [Dyadobacter sp. CY323]
MFNEYYRLKAEELLNELSQVKTFIKKHNPTIGILTEEILRKFLSTFLPKSVSVEQGFVVGSNGELSKQVDILIYDSQSYAPYYRINDIVVVPNEAVLAVVEVKTTVIGKTEFHKIIEYFYSISKQLNPSIAKYLFIYNSADVQKLDSYFRSFKHSGSYQEFDHDTFHHLPDAITGINSSYHLKKDYVTFSERDMMGYTSYNYRDNTDKAISSLELFYRDIFEHIFNHSSSKTKQGNKIGDVFIKNDNKLVSVSAIELFFM